MKPTVDMTTFVAVESIFRDGPVDPWAFLMAGRLADVYVYADEIRVPWPSHDAYERGGCLPRGPGLLECMSNNWPGNFSAALYMTDDRLRLQQEALRSTMRQFITWVQANPIRFRTWCDLHAQGWVREGHQERVKHGLVFELEEFYADGDLERVGGMHAYPVEHLAYALDVILRYPLYGCLTPSGERFLNHPIRDVIALPGMNHDAAPPPVPITFANSVSQLSRHLNQEQYLTLLAEIRQVVQEQELFRLAPGMIEKDQLRDIASRLALPARLRSLGKVAGIAAGVIGGLGALPALGPVAAVAGGAIGVTTSLWKGHVPRSLCKISWLRWAFEWDLEAQGA